MSVSAVVLKSCRAPRIFTVVIYVSYRLGRLRLKDVGIILKLRFDAAS